VFCQSFAPGSLSWLSRDPAGVGMQLDAAFRAFAATVNAHPENATTPLEVHRNHADGTGNHWGFVRELGHPVTPAQVMFYVESPNSQGVVLQGDTQSNFRVIFGGAPVSALSNQASNGGYGWYGVVSLSSTALAYLDTTISHSNIGAVLLIAQDTTPGAELFCWTLKTFGGTPTLHRDSCHMLFKSPGGDRLEYRHDLPQE